VIPQFGVDPELFFPGDGGPPEAFVVGFVGRLVREKGVDLLIRAGSALDHPWRIEVVGDGEERPALERLARELGTADRVRFLGPVPSVGIASIVRGFSALALPSRSLPSWREQFGRALIEGMASGVPVIGSTCGEIPRVIGDAGLTFPEGDWAALAECLVRLQRDPDERRELGRRARARVLDYYTQARVAEQTVGAYRSLLDRAMG
jgi:glycosyltransferase involved in cell wall biosynthesis